VARTLWPGENAIGKRFSEADTPKPEDWCTVIGVVDDIRQGNLTQPMSASAYYPYTQVDGRGWLGHMTFVARVNGPVQPVAAGMRAAVRATDGDLAIGRIEAMNDVIAATGAERTFQARLLSAFAVLALAIAVIGIYGVIAYSVTLRTREIGIRMAMGAKAGDVLTLVLRRTLALAAAGLAIGSVGAYFATRVLEKMLFQVTPHDPATMVAVAALLAVAAIGAGWIPARRAARVDPLVALRWE